MRVGDASRRHFAPQPQQQTAPVRTGKRITRVVPVDKAGAAATSSSSSQRLGERYWADQRKATRRPERVHVAGPAEGKQADTNEDLTRALGSKGKPRTGTGDVRRYLPAEELSLERALTRRRRIDAADKYTQRNGIGMGKPGDKPVAAAEYEPGFYHGGGVVAGSTSGLHKAYPPRRRVRSSEAAALASEASEGVRGFGQAPPPPPVPSTFGAMTLEQRRRAEALVEDMQQVEALNPDADSSDDEAEADEERAATWEEATGNFTVTHTKPSET